MDVFPKFIIEDGDLIVSKVSYHREMASDHSKVIGGGWFRIVQESNTMIFHGESDQFGKAKFEDIKTCVESGRIYSNPMRTHSIVDRWNFAYDSGSEIIQIEKGLNPINN